MATTAQPASFTWLCQYTWQRALRNIRQPILYLNNNDGKTEASTWSRNHDLTHVLFGTVPFEIRGKTINDLWTIFGSDVTLKGYVRFSQ